MIRSIPFNFRNNAEKTRDTVERVVKRADTALYQSKENGRNQITGEPDWKVHMPPRRPRPKAPQKKGAAQQERGGQGTRTR